MNQQKRGKWGAIAVAGITLLGVATTARADIKVTSEVTVKGRPEVVKSAVPEKSISVSYYKGDKLRVETEKPTATPLAKGEKAADAEKIIVISDLANGKTYTLDPVKKTFSVVSPADMDKMMADNPFLQMLKVETQTTVTPGTATRAIAGKNAKQYLYDTNFKISLEGGDDQVAGLADMMPAITIKGEQWTSEEINFPIDYQKVAQNSLSHSVPPIMAKGMKEMFEKFSAIKGFPLSYVVTVTFIFPKNAPPQMVANFPKEPMVTTSEVKSITEGALDDSLFIVPADYKEIKAVIPGAPAAPPASPN